MGGGKSQFHEFQSEIKLSLKLSAFSRLFLSSGGGGEKLSEAKEGTAIGMNYDY